MSRSKQLLVACAAVACVASAAASQSLPQSQPLPAFSVAAPGGGTVNAAALSPEPQWVLLYVRPEAVATTRLLEALAAWQLPPDALRRIVLVVEGPADKASAYMAAKWTAANPPLAWYADPEGQAAAALGLTGAPALKGIKSGAVEWSLEGVLNDPAAYEPTLRTWIGAR